MLYLTKEKMNSSQLSKALNIDQGNLSKFMNPILEKGYITGIRISREKFFQRAEILDLIGFEDIPEFSELIKKWEQGLHDS
jgi:DNA-binding MarR family transcriptional regulator